MTGCILALNGDHVALPLGLKGWWGEITSCRAVRLACVIRFRDIIITGAATVLSTFVLSRVWAWWRALPEICHWGLLKLSQPVCLLPVCPHRLASVSDKLRKRMSTLARLGALQTKSLRRAAVVSDDIWPAATAYGRFDNVPVVTTKPRITHTMRHHRVMKGGCVHAKPEAPI